MKRSCLPLSLIFAGWMGFSSLQAQVVGPYNGVTYLSNLTGPCNATTLAVLGDADFSSNGTYEINFGSTFSGTWANGQGYTDGPGPEVLCVSLHTQESWDVRFRLSDGSFTGWQPVVMATILDSVIWNMYSCAGFSNPNWDYDRRVELVDFASFSIPIGLTVVGAEFTLTGDNAGYSDPVGMLMLGSAPVIDSAWNNGPLCAGDTLRLFGPNRPSATFSWNGPGGFNSALQNPVIPNAGTSAAGTYTVIANDSLGIDTFTTTVVIHPTPAGSIQFTTGCSSEPVSFSFTNTSSATISDYAWNFGTGNPGDTSDLAAPVFTFPGSGTYTVTLDLTSSNGCTAEFDTVLTLSPSPTADFFTQSTCFQELIFTSSSVPEPSLVQWEWILPDTVILQLDSSVTFSHQFDSAGIYPVTLVVTDANGCTDSVTYPIQVFQTVGLPPMPDIMNLSSGVGNEKYDFEVFASPFNHCYDYTFTIYNRWGFKVFETSSDAANPDVNCSQCFKGYSSDGARLSAGIYYYVLQAVPEYSTKGTITVVE